MLEELEGKLLGARVARLHYEVVAEGAYTARAEGALLVAAGGRVRLSGKGAFGGEAMSVELWSDGARMRGGARAKPFAEQATPPGLAEALWVGLTRMGILHNLAELSEGSPPDHAEGGVRAWVRVGDPVVGAKEQVEGVLARPLRFDILVRGSKASGEATLWVDAATGLPVKRVQVVHFPDGDMRVVERYRAVELDAAVGEEAFRMAGE